MMDFFKLNYLFLQLPLFQFPVDDNSKNVRDMEWNNEPAEYKIRSDFLYVII